MTERLQKSPEHFQDTPETLERAEHERLANERERNAERSAEKNTSDLKNEALEAAAKAEKKVDADHNKAPAEKKRDTPATRRAKQKANFNKTMKEAQSHMSPAARTFSKIIHTKSIEKTSEVVGSTVARPNAILAGAVTAFTFSLLLYLVANHNGYPLSGTETIATFIVGWAAGLLFDYVRIMVTGKKS